MQVKGQCVPKNVSWQTDMWTALTNFAQGTTLKTDDSQDGSSATVAREWTDAKDAGGPATDRVGHQKQLGRRHQEGACR